MITEQLVKDDFVAQILRRDIAIICNTQNEVARRYFNVRTGTLKAALQSPEIKINSAAGRHTLYMRILPYLRFLDMQYRLKYSGTGKREKHNRAKYAIYNRVVWGVLYNETFPDIQAGFTNEVRMAWRKKMEQALADNILTNQL